MAHVDFAKQHLSTCTACTSIYGTLCLSAQSLRWCAEQLFNSPLCCVLWLAACVAAAAEALQDQPTAQKAWEGSTLSEATNDYTALVLGCM